MTRFKKSVRKFREIFWMAREIAYTDKRLENSDPRILSVAASATGFVMGIYYAVKFFILGV